MKCSYKPRLTYSSDQIRDNVLSNQYFCDVDIGHLIQYDEELAQKLNNEPADYIPLVRHDLLYLAMILELTHYPVRSSTAHLHAAHPLPLTKRRRPRAREGIAHPPTSATLLRLANIHTWPHRNKCLPPRPHTRHCNWCQHPLLKSYEPLHSMQKLRQRRTHRRELRIQRHHTSSSMQQT